MSSTLLDQIRCNHEEIERLERLVVQDLQTHPSSSKDRLVQGHRIRNTIHSIMRAIEKLVETYEDKDGARDDEIAALGGHTATGVNVYSAFYDRLKEIREYHRKYPSGPLADATADYEALLQVKPVISFSGEEGVGRYLDLHDMYNQYINSKFGDRVEYSAYLDVFSHPEKIPCKLKLSRQYMKYMEALLEYLVNFFQRTEPLQDLDKMLSKVETDFEEQFADGKVIGWESHGQESKLVPSEHTVIDFGYYTTVDELIGVGPEKLKEALGALGLKVGGTLQQRAERLFLIKNTPLEKLDKKHFAKPALKGNQNGDAKAMQGADSSAKQIALTEAKVKKLCNLLDETIERTKQNVVKKQAMTYEEMEEEHKGEEERAEIESDDEEEEGGFYNPLNLPMGVDGKPIPYWLYKLHGLGQKFKCEICRNKIYKGRRAFERHFKESQHQDGMRCLGIPNTKNFNEITSIEEAKELWKRIQERQGVNKWRPEVEEEYEDGDGNVYNKKTYSDLKRQGLI
ncbi:splicing factor SF3a60 homolog [Brassica rapa]|uniref:Matrin-type domain-containing protein n=1 Tax=Brassica campestris TaxID=3711 RepID=M4CNU4_BRACM|nr:splicing factor SF3a60 homolog [Brassica rapa]